MIEMPVGQENSPNRERAPPIGLKSTFHCPNRSDEPGVDQVESIDITEDVMDDSDRANRKDVIKLVNGGVFDQIGSPFSPDDLPGIDARPHGR